MERWVLYATLSMLFAGFTSVIAKMGMGGHFRRAGTQRAHAVRLRLRLRVALMFVDPAELPG